MRLEPDRRWAWVAGTSLALAVVWAALVVSLAPYETGVIGPTPAAIVVPPLTNRFGDLVTDPDRHGTADAFRGLWYQDVWLGEWRHTEVGDAWETAHALRFGALEFSRVRVHRHDGQVVAVRAYEKTRGGAVVLGDVVNDLSLRFGQSTVRGRGPNWARRWDGEEVVVTLRAIDATRLEFEAVLRSAAVGRPFVRTLPEVAHLPTRALDADAVPGAPHALFWIEFVEEQIPPPRVRCRLNGLELGVLRARLTYESTAAAVDVPIVDRTLWIPWRPEATGVLDVEGYAPVVIRWGEPEGREWSWCEGIEVRLQREWAGG